MAKLVCFGGGDMAEKGIIPVVGGKSITREECDVTDWNQVARQFDERVPEVVVITAGESEPGPITRGRYREEIFTNLVGSAIVSEHAVSNGVKTVILIGSVAGKYGKPNHAGYCASKAGVISLAQSLAMEGHDAYCISPGRVDTKMRERDYPQDKPGSRLDPKEIGEIVKDILDGKYDPGDNIIIRPIGVEGERQLIVDKGDPWKERLSVGKPVTV